MGADQAGSSLYTAEQPVPGPVQPAPGTARRGVGVRQLSPKLRLLVARLAGEVPGLVDRTLRAVREEVDEYGAIVDENLFTEVRAVIETNATIWYSALLSGRPPDPSDLDALARFARRRVSQGVPLAAMLHSFRVGSQVFWQVMLDQAEADGGVVSEMLFAVSPYAFAHANAVSIAVSHAYADELNSHIRWQDRLRHELFDLLMGEELSDDDLRSRSLTTKINPDEAYFAVALQVELPSEDLDARQDPYRLWREQLLSRLGLQRDAVLDTVRDRCCLVLAPASPGRTPREEHEVGGLLERLAGVPLDPPLVAVGLGTMGRGAAGWRRSCLQALRAIHVGARVQPATLVHRYSELVLYDVALRTPEIADCLRVMARELISDETLLLSVSEYFRHSSHTRSAARALHVHPNTLLYRLRKVERLLGGRFDDPDWSLQVQFALKLLSLSPPSPGGESGPTPAPARAPALATRTKNFVMTTVDARAPERNTTNGIPESA